MEVLERTRRANEYTAETTRDQEVVDRTARARDSFSAATPPPPARVQSVTSRSERPGDDAFTDGSVAFMDASARVEFPAKLRAEVVAKASALPTSVRRTSLYPSELLSVRQAWSKMDNSSWQGQLRAAPTLDFVPALRTAHDEATTPFNGQPSSKSWSCLLYTSPSPRD